MVVGDGDGRAEASLAADVVLDFLLGAEAAGGGVIPSGEAELGGAAAGEGGRRRLEDGHGGDGRGGGGGLKRHRRDRRRRRKGGRGKIRLGLVDSLFLPLAYMSNLKMSLSGKIKMITKLY